MKGWGKRKIVQHLNVKQISDYCQRKGLSEIDEEEYLNTLYTYLEKELDKIQELKPFEIRQRLFKKGYNKGFETPLINSVIAELIANTTH